MSIKASVWSSEPKEVSGKTSSQLDRFRDVFANVASASLYPASVELFTQGWRADDVYLVEEGVVKLNRVSRGGSELTVDIRSTGAVLGAAAAILGDPHPTSAITVTRCKLYRMGTKAFVGVLQNDAGLSWHLQRMHCQEMLGQIARVEEFGSHSARQRLERLIGMIASNSEKADEKDLKIPLRQFEIAALVGVTPEYLSIILRQLEREGLVRRVRRQLLIGEQARLLNER